MEIKMGKRNSFKNIFLGKLEKPIKIRPPKTKLYNKY
jgi:hypothetical protein